MMAPLNNDCVMHAQELQEIKSDIKEIKDSLLGTLKEEGFLSKIDRRVIALEGFKRVQEWITRSIVVAALGGVVTILIMKMSI